MNRIALALCLAIAPASAVVLEGGRCPSTTVYGAKENAAGVISWVDLDAFSLLKVGGCADIKSAHAAAGFLPNKLKICGPIDGTLSRMSCEKHDYKAFEITQGTDKFAPQDCKVYDLGGTPIDGYV